jgi:anthranilate phosphoribosyltransferase
VLGNLGSLRCFVVHGCDGLDEITTTDQTDIAELRDGDVHLSTMSPEDFGLRRADLRDLKVSGPDESAAAIREILSGGFGPRTDIVLLNAAAALVAAGLADTIASGLAIARKSIASGAAMEALHKLVEVSCG